MKWIEIVIKTTGEASDAISEMLMSMGSGGVSIEDPDDIRKAVASQGSLDYADDKFLNSLGDDVTVKAYFPGDVNMVELSGLLEEKIRYISGFLDTGKGYIGYGEINEEDWANAWKKYYKPVHITENTVIKPSWEEYAHKGSEIVIELDPGMAFGTGTHETTIMCARLLEKYIMPGDSIIDLGCGTGILSIIAAKRGAESVKAIDIDPVAVRITNENCILNRVSDKVAAVAGELVNLKHELNDIMIANIISDIIIKIGKLVPAHVKPGGYMITSGIIRERKQDVLDEYLNLGFCCEEIIEIGEWVAMALRCPDSL